MPTYTFRNKETNETFEQFMSISAREMFLKENSHIEAVVGVSNIVSSVDVKPDNGFRDVLREIRRKHDARWTRSTINTF